MVEGGAGCGHRRTAEDDEPAVCLLSRSKLGIEAAGPAAFLRNDYADIKAQDGGEVILH